jgi:amino acid transporter
MPLLRLLLGRRLASHEQSERKIGVIAGVPALGLDGLASSAYGPEALLAVLIPLGAAGLHYVGPLILVILALLAILYFSYRQTIGAYPGGGGSYTVARENLGTTAGLIAAAALMIDYILNVAVAISAGIAALVSAFPGLHKYTLALCLATLAVIALVNLRGTLEAGWAFALPTYLFVASFATVLVTGVVKAVTHGGAPHAVVPPPALPAAAGVASLWLLMHSFASGCTAMTGVEAVSNGITAFREPAVTNARRTLTVIVAILAALLGGIAYLSRAYGIGAMNQEQEGYQSVLSQLVGAVFGRGAFYYVAIGSLLAVVCLSANTSFMDFPRLCRLLAGDRFLPTAFSIVGRRLVFSVGIVFLTVSAGLLLVVFRGITDRLIPLFAIGAFLAFTLSQAGMVVHWRKYLRTRPPDAHRTKVRLAVNAVGALATGAALVVILVAKFKEGAWITILALPLLIGLFRLVKRHYVRVARQIRKPEPLDIGGTEPPVVVIPTEGWNRLTDKALRFALRLSPDVHSVHLNSADGGAHGPHPDADAAARERAETLRNQWCEEVEEPAKRAGLSPPHLEVIQSPYRKFLDPLIDYIERLKQQHPDRLVTVVVPEVVKRRWWQFLLHNYRAERLRSALLRRGDPRLVVVSIPWYIEDAADAQAAAAASSRAALSNTDASDAKRAAPADRPPPTRHPGQIDRSDPDRTSSPSRKQTIGSGESDALRP